jgi:hypothetical protein
LFRFQQSKSITGRKSNAEANESLSPLFRKKPLLSVSTSEAVIDSEWREGEFVLFISNEFGSVEIEIREASQNLTPEGNLVK